MERVMGFEPTTPCLGITWGLFRIWSGVKPPFQHLDLVSFSLLNFDRSMSHHQDTRPRTFYDLIVIIAISVMWVCRLCDVEIR